jgi:hypothetical protein
MISCLVHATEWALLVADDIWDSFAAGGTQNETIFA